MSAPFAPTQRSSRSHVETRRAPQYVYTDVDRTIANTDNHLQHVYPALAQCGINPALFRKLADRAMNPKRGVRESLQVVPVLETLCRRSVRVSVRRRVGMDDEARTALVEATVAKKVAAFLNAYEGIDLPDYPIPFEDTRPFLDVLQSVPSGALSFTHDPRLQYPKIRKSGFRGSITLLDHENKGDFIAGLRVLKGRHKGKFRVPHYDEQGLLVCNYLVDSVCLVEDKSGNFGPAFPPDCTGVVVQRDDLPFPELSAPLDEQVQFVRSLGNLAVVEGRLLPAPSSALVA